MVFFVCISFILHNLICVEFCEISDDELEFLILQIRILLGLEIKIKRKKNQILQRTKNVPFRFWSEKLQFIP